MMLTRFPRLKRILDPGVAPLADDLQRDEARTQALAEMLSTGIEPGHSLLGLLVVESRPLSAEGRVEAMLELANRYEEARARIALQRGLWSECFAHVGPRLVASSQPRAERLRQLERKRVVLETTARNRSDAELLARTSALKERLEASLRALSGAVAAMVRRADRGCQVLSEWDRRAQEQAILLGQLRESVEARVRVLELEREVLELEEGSGESARAAGGAGSFVDLLGPLDRGLASARAADDRLQKLVRDLLGVAAQLEGEGGVEGIEAAERLAGEALLSGPLDDGALLALALSDAPTIGAGPPEPLEHRLRKVEVALDRGCLTAFGEEAFLRRAQRSASPHVWREYMRRYPNAAAVADARAALETLDRTALEAAVRAASRHGWRSYLRDFPEGTGAGQAKEALDKLPPVPAATEVLKRLSSPTEGSLFLGELAALECQVGWGTLRINEGGTVQILGEPCGRFLSPHPPSRIVYAVPEGFTRFTAIGAGFDGPEAAHGTWRYEVRLDDRQVFQSGPLHEQPTGIPIELPLPAGTRQLEIRIDDYGDSHYDWAVLAHPLLHRS